MEPTDPKMQRKAAEYLTVPGVPLKSRPSYKRKTSWLSTKLSRNSSLTSQSRSIPIFVHVGELLKPAGSSPRSPPLLETHAPSSNWNWNTVQSDMGVNRAVPNTPSSEMRTMPKPAGQASTSDSKVESKTKVQEKKVDTEDARSETGTRSLYSLFPEPPDPLEHFDKWFPETLREQTPVEEKQKVAVNKTLPQPPYHVFNRSKKLQIVILVSFAGILSPLSTSIYLPALAEIATEFSMSNEVVLLTVMVFMIFQGIAPFFWMPLCGALGRRPIFIIALIVFIGANIGLVFSKTFAALMILRAAQSIGSAALTATCAAVIGDVSTSKERGRFIGLFGGILMFTFISPVFGGILTHWMGFRSIFWFLFAFGSVVLILILMILPETLRSIAGNGTIRLRSIQQPLIYIFRSSSDTPFDSDLTSFAVRTNIRSNVLSMHSIIEPFRCLTQKDVLVNSLLGSVTFAVCTTVITTTTTMFEPHYHLSVFAIGLAFLPAGAGSVISFFLMGYLMDYDLRVIENKYRSLYDLETNVSLDHKLLSDFPIERARLRNAWWITLIFVGATAGYGFSFCSTTIAGPLILQFFIASSATALLLINGVLIADLYSGHGSVTLAVNLVRFLMGALAVGTVQLALNRIGNGYTFFALAMAMFSLTPIMVIQWVFGRPWKAKRNSTWPRRKLSADLGLPLKAVTERILRIMKNTRLSNIRAVGSETVESVRSRSRNKHISRWPS